MSQVVKNNRGFLQFLAVCPAHQRQFLLQTASPQQLHSLVQVLYNILKEYVVIPEENKRNVLPYKDALVNLAETNVPYKTKKRILVQEGDGFIPIKFFFFCSFPFLHDYDVKMPNFAFYGGRK